MPNYLHRTTKQYLQSISPASLPEPVENYIFMPDLSAVEGVPNRYWKITGDVVSEMTQEEKATVDAQILNDTRDAIIAEIDNLEAIMRALTKILISEINILRQQFNTTTSEVPQLTTTTFADRTLAQVRNQLRNNLGS